MVSYADMVTLLLACFAALYASSLVPPALASDEPADPSATASLAEALQEAVDRVDDSGAVVVRADAEVVVVSLPEAGAFAVGQADLSQAARRILRELADTLVSEPGDIRIEGHTDNVPITTSRYASNWELSAARATEVIRFLLAQSTLTPDRLSAAGYGEFRPVDSNDTPEGRARNRRVDVVVVKR
jgi:chemotaxis protein MotB